MRHPSLSGPPAPGRSGHVSIPGQPRTATRGLHVPTIAHTDQWAPRYEDEFDDPLVRPQSGVSIFTVLTFLALSAALAVLIATLMS